MPTRTDYVNYLHGLIGYYGAGAGHDENDVPFNTWYYGRRVSGLDYAWCAVLQCYVENHFNILSKNGGKVAYVPNMPSVGRRCGAKVWDNPRHGSDAYQPGNKVGFDFNRSGSAEHTGTYWKPRDSSTFYSIDGNTGNDQVAIRVRNYGDVLFVVETLGLDGTTTPPPIQTGSNDVPDYVSLTTKNSISVDPDKGFHVQFDTVTHDTANRRGAGVAPGIFVAGKNGSVYACTVELQGPASWVLHDVRQEGSDWKVHNHNAGAGPDFADAGNHLWLWVQPHAKGEVLVNVKCAIWDK